VHDAASARHPAHLRRLNIDRVLSIAIDRPGTFTRAELIEESGLSAPTIGDVSAHLIRKGVVKDLGTGPSRGGRRPSLMEFNARHGFIAVMDIGPTRTRLAVADLRGEPIAHTIVETHKSLPPQRLLARLAGDLSALLERVKIQQARLLTVVAGAPGIVRVKDGVVVMAPNLADWRDVPMRDILSKELHTTVVVENDVNLALLGEHWRGAARGHETCAFLFVGTGIGAAVLIDGVLLHGHHDMAGEIAVMCMGPQFVGRDFGGRGCLETLAGLDALKARWPAGVGRNPEEWIPALLEAAASGDAQARQAVDETAQMIGIAAANLGAVVDPSVVVLGGAMFAQSEPFVDAVRVVVRRLQRNPFDVVLSELGKEAPVAGGLLVAAAEARRQLTHRLELSVARSVHP
jgi:predicted NBD/HSP70 family sugar kinase